MGILSHRIGPAAISFGSRRTLLPVALMLFLCLFVPRAHGQSREYQLKAAFVFNFAQFTDFPTNAFPSTNSPLVIAVLGENPFGDTLQKLVEGERIAGHPVEVRQCERVSETEGAHVLFLARSAWPSWREVARRVAGKPMLTVCEMETFTREGGMIRLFTAGNKIQFNINPTAAQKAGLNLSSKLLRLATIVREGDSVE